MDAERKITPRIGRRLAQWSIQDRLEIEEIICAVPMYADQRDFDAAEALFTELATLDYTSSYGASRGTSRQPKSEYWARVKEQHPGFEGTIHPTSNFVISVDGDRATCVSYVMAVMRVGKDTWSNGGTYYHELVRTRDGWRIQHLQYEMRFDVGDREAVISQAKARVAGGKV
jgi:hypothetical protein